MSTHKDVTARGDRKVIHISSSRLILLDLSTSISCATIIFIHCWVPFVVKNEQDDFGHPHTWWYINRYVAVYFLHQHDLTLLKLKLPLCHYA